MKTDQYWPNLNFEMKTEFIETKTAYKWRVQVHVIGPDDILEWESSEFTSKKDCSIDLMSNAFLKAQYLVANA